MTLLVPQVIILESFLSFFGLGVQEPMSSWGVLISQGAKNIPVGQLAADLPVLLPDHDALRAQFHRRRPARCARPEGPLSDRRRRTHPLVARICEVRFRTLDGVVDAVKGVNLKVEAGRDGGRRRRIGIRQEPDR